MKVILQFDYYSNIMYIPDGYIKDLNEMHMNFFDWLSEQSECYISKNGVCGLSYNEMDFLKYVNEVILKESDEKAYITKNIRKSKQKVPILKF